MGEGGQILSRGYIAHHQVDWLNVRLGWDTMRLQICWLLLLLLLSYGIASSFFGSAIPFNYPGTRLFSHHLFTIDKQLSFNFFHFLRFCGSCDIGNINFTMEPLNELDTKCMQYLRRITTGKKASLQRNLHILLQEILATEKTNSSWIFFSFVQARPLFEFLFRKNYTYRLYVQPHNATNTNSGSCINICQEGEGFITSGYNVSQLDPTKRSLFAMGKRYEWRYARGIADLWAVESCKEASHSLFVSKKFNCYSKLSFGQLKTRTNSMVR